MIDDEDDDIRVSFWVFIENEQCLQPMKNMKEPIFVVPSNIRMQIQEP